MSTGALWVGTSGFAYPEWKGSFYPAGLPQARMLAHYATLLPSVEINYTFRRLPTEKVLERWRAQPPDGFRLTLQAPRRIPHIKRRVDLGDAADPPVRR